MKAMSIVLMMFWALMIGCGDDSDDSRPSPSATTAPAGPSASGAIVDAAQRDGARGARATGGLIDAPPASAPATP